MGNWREHRCAWTYKRIWSKKESRRQKLHIKKRLDIKEPADDYNLLLMSKDFLDAGLEHDGDEALLKESYTITS